MKRITQSQIARDLNLSQSAVSLVLRDRSTTRVSEETRRRIFDHLAQFAPEAMPWRPSRNICLLLSPRYQDLSQRHSPFLIRILAGAEEACRSYKMNLVFKQWDEQTFSEALLGRDHYAGFFNVGYLEDSRIRQLRRHGPVVIVNWQLDAPLCDVVALDDAAGVKQAVQYLYGLGHRRIAYLGVAPAPETIRNEVHAIKRVTGYYHGLRWVGLPYLPQYVAGVRRVAGGNEYAGYEQAVASFARLPQPPTAIVVCNDKMAIEFMAVAKEAGVRIPEDLSVVGFDNEAAAQECSPPLTTIHHEREEMGRRAVELIVNRNNNGALPSKPVEILCGAELVERDSVRAISTSKRPAGAWRRAAVKAQALAGARGAGEEVCVFG